MNIQIQAKQYRSGSEIIQDHKDRRKRFERAGRMALLKSMPALPAPEKPFPQWELYDTSFDSHVVEWRMRKINPPLTYVKDRCLELGWSFATIMGPQRRYEVVRVRQLLMWELSEKFQLSQPKIGRLFGKDHTTVLHALRKVEALGNLNVVPYPFRKEDRKKR